MFFYGHTGKKNSSALTSHREGIMQDVQHKIWQWPLRKSTQQSNPSDTTMLANRAQGE